MVMAPIWTARHRPAPTNRSSTLALVTCLVWAASTQCAFLAGCSALPTRKPSVLARRARSAFIAVVDVDVKEGSEEAFLAASLANARGSMKEDKCQRFDVLQLQEDSTRFALVEIYRAAQGPVDHKAAEHYLTWREEVAPMMASPRSATQWDTIYPSVASGFAPKALVLERTDPMYFDITHVFVDVVPGMEEEFRAATLANAQASVREAENLRFDVLRGVDDPTKFLLIEVYRTPRGAAEHKETEHYLTWRKTVADMMASPRSAKKYRNHFPNLPAGWQCDGDVGQAGGKNWAR